MKKCCFVIPYFGNFPNYFQLFLNSCKKNPNYDWLFFTDNKVDYSYPDNVKKIYMSFNDLRELIQSRFQFKISLAKPFKLCDYRPAFGYIFERYLSEYSWWGHCDVDTLMGDLDKFISNKMLNDYDKLFDLGHFIMYKNTFENNRLFMSEINGTYWYKEVFTIDKSMIFDEVYGGKKNINTIFKISGKRIFENDLSLNFSPVKLTRFVKTTYNPPSERFEDEGLYKNKLVVWDNGHIFRYEIHNAQLTKKEYMYLHLQSRNMKSEELGDSLFAVIPNKFINLNRSDLVLLDHFKKVPKIESDLALENLFSIDKLIYLVRSIKNNIKKNN